MIPFGAPVVAGIIASAFDVNTVTLMVLSSPGTRIPPIETAGIISILSTASTSVADSV